MKNQSGYIHLVVIILISVMAIGLLGTAWWYEENKPVPRVVINTITNNANVANSNSNQNLQIFSYGEDEHGCDTSLGLYWCELSQRCINHNFEECESINKELTVESTPEQTQYSSENETNNNVNSLEQVLESGPIEIDLSQCPEPPDTSQTWDTLISDEYKYQIRYPKNFLRHSGNGYETFDTLNSEGIWLVVTYPPAHHLISFNPNETTLEEWVKANIVNGDKTYLGLRKIDGHIAAVVTEAYDLSATRADEYYIDRDGVIFEILVSYPSKAYTCETWKLYEFINSFKFLE